MADLTALVSIDANLGVARLGATEVSIAAREGAIHLLPPAGPVLRPLSLDERNRIVWSAAGSPDPGRSACRGIGGAATVEPGEGDPSLLNVTALALAGATLDAPSFAECILLVARATGWTPEALANMPAIEVDRLALQLAPPRGESGWNRIVFAPGEGSLESLRDELADNLLRRAAASTAERDIGAEDGPLQAPLENGRHASEPWTDPARAGRGDGQEADAGMPRSTFSPRPGEPAAGIGASGAPSSAGRSAIRTGADSSRESPFDVDERGSREPLPLVTGAPVGADARRIAPASPPETDYSGFEIGSPAWAREGGASLPAPDAAAPYRPARPEGARGAPANLAFAAWAGESAARPRDESRPYAVDFEAPGGPTEGADRRGASGMEFLLSGDAIAGADAIAALLHQEADLRGLDR